MSDTPIIKTAIPQIPAQDIAATLAFYKQKLGFKIAFQMDGYAGIERDGALVHIYHHEDRGLAEQTMYRMLVSQVDQLCAEFQANGLDCQIKMQPWGTKDLPVIDPAGNCLTFFEDGK